MKELSSEYTVEQILEELRASASEKYKENVVRMGIPKEQSIGVSTADVRSLAKKIGKSDELAFELWRSGYHEARLLAVLLFDKKSITAEEIQKLMSEVVSWDLCDHLCKNLIIKRRDYNEFISKWIDSPKTYEKRAAFTLMASVVVHDRKLSDDMLADYLNLIREYSQDEHEHIRKAVSWALREIGKKDFDYNEKALIVAYELRENGNKAQVWIAREAIKELEKLVKVEGRGRLISNDSKMGRTE